MILSRSGFVINGDPFYSPKIAISPFSLASPQIPLKVSQKGMKVFDDIFRSVEWSFTKSGKNAIEIALRELGVGKNDEVWIQTSSQNSYVSRCVTEMISNFCSWSMVESEKTKVIYFIHDFGEDGTTRLAEFQNRETPIIEDAAYGLITAIEGNWDFSRSEYILFSFPKVFEMQLGGILCGSITQKAEQNDLLDLVARGSSNWIIQHEEIFARRKVNYAVLKREFERLGFKTNRELLFYENPGVFMFSTESGFPLDELKFFFNNHGCESSVFYGRLSYFLPTHQNLNERTIMYMADLLDAFIVENPND